VSRGLGWYARRLGRMSPGEVAVRTHDAGLRLAWAPRRVAPAETLAVTRPRTTLVGRPRPLPLPAGTADLVPAAARDAVVGAADDVLAGRWRVLGVTRPDSAAPDWFLDPVTGRRAPQDRLCFAIDHRDEAVTGNVKQVWELSRHHHLTVLAAAWWLTGEERYAATVAAQLRDWWRTNPFLSGICWTSGIELGVRLTSWAWIRRLLDGWSGVGALFEENDLALRQLWWHQRWLAAFPSTGSSGNNHLVAEQAGRLVAACAFGWFAESDAWRRDAAARLGRALRANTDRDGLNRELATDYHRFVAELGLVAAVEAEAAAHPLDEPTTALLTAMLDAAAALPDATGRPPRQGDGDEGRALVVDGPRDPGTDAGPEEAWAQLLSAGASYAGAPVWWPATSPTVLSVAVGALTGALTGAGLRGDRPTTRPDVFHDAGLAILRTPRGTTPELWVRCDGGPHGFGSMAAHAHADALAVEVRYAGVDVLADPGTYCYHGEPAWRSYFRSTAAHSTVEVDGADQSVSGGPFLWTRSAHAEVDALLEHGADDGPRLRTWVAHHDGYAGVRHDRMVTLVAEEERVRIVDLLTPRDGRPHRVRVMLHLGPLVRVTLGGGPGLDLAVLVWPRGRATLRLDPGLSWSTHRGETDPVLGWYSPRFGTKVPTTVLTGSGLITEAREITTALTFLAVPAGNADVPLPRRSRGRHTTEGGSIHG